MTPEESESIVRAYGGAIGQNKNLFKKVSTLPCSKFKIRQAFCLYISAIIEKMGALPKDMGNNLVNIYCMLDTFIDDNDAERLNIIWEKLHNNSLDEQSPKNKEQISKILSLYTKRMRNGIYFDEINEYIGECKNEKNKTGFYSISDIVEEIENTLE